MANHILVPNIEITIPVLAETKMTQMTCRTNSKMEDPMQSFPPSFLPSSSVASAPTKSVDESVYGFQNVKALQRFCSTPPEQHFKLRIHFPFQSFESLGESVSCDRTEQSFYETLYDTEDLKLLTKCWALETRRKMDFKS